MRKLRNIWLGLALALFITACKSEPAIDLSQTYQRYDYGFDTGGMGGKGWDIWVEDLIINERLSIPGGGFSGGTPDPNERLPDGASAIMGETPLPRTVYAYWFSFRLQQFFEVTAVIPTQHHKKIKEWLKRYPQPKYLHKLVSGIAGRGEAQFWWFAGCVGHDCPQDYYETHSFELTPLLKATPTEGNAKNHRSQTLLRIKEGTLPEEIAYHLAYRYGLDIASTNNAFMIAEPMTVTSDTLELETDKETGIITYQSEQKLYLMQPGQPNLYNTPPQLMRLPHTVRVEWLDLVTQTNYGKTFTITQAQREQLFAFILQYPERDYRHALMTTVEENGQVQLEWQVQCLEEETCPEPDTNGHRFELEPKTQADEHWQNTDKHLEVIQALIASGQLPNAIMN